MADDIQPLQVPDDNPEELARAFSQARPRWATDGFGLRGPQEGRTSRQPGAIAPPGSVIREPKQPAFPDLDEEQPTPAKAQGSETNQYSFKGSVDSIDKDAGTVDIHVGYGEIKEEAPAGMTGADDYILTISADGTEIYAVVTFDPTTLDITSRSLAFGPSVPDTVLGTLYFPLIAVDIAYDTGGKIKEVVPRNRHCGDIVFELLYTSLNGQPALFPAYGQPLIPLPDALVT